MTIDTKRLATNAAYWDEVAGTATHYCPSNKQFYDFRLHPCCIPRPTKPAAPEWNGKGLPPVGCECEVRDAGVNFRSEFVKVIPLFYSDQICVLQHWASGNHFSKRLEDVEFRPLRTAEQRQREEILDIMAEQTYLSHIAPRDAKAIADAILSNYNLEKKS